MSVAVVVIALSEAVRPKYPLSFDALALGLHYADTNAHLPTPCPFSFLKMQRWMSSHSGTSTDCEGFPPLSECSLF